MDRPVTSKSRGICKYYKELRGCFAGNKCKFLHDEPNTRSLTPYDQAKTCRFYAQGFCKRGDKCWFKHTARPRSPGLEDENEPCSICFEQPVTYGLLMGCSHVFCISCIKQWRDSSKQNRDPGPSKVTKQCPMCRAPSAYITPSSIFYKNEDPRKEKIIISYKESMARVPCRYFQASKMEDATNPFCPFGKDCFYQHLNEDGTPHVFTQGVDMCMRIYSRRRARPVFSFPGNYSDPVEMIELLMDTMDNHFNDMGTFEGTLDAMRAELRRLGSDSNDGPVPFPPAEAVSHHIDLLRPVRPVGSQTRRPPVSGETMPNLEPIISSSSHGNRTREGERRDTHDSDDSMPPLEDVSDSGSESGWSTEDDEDDDLGRDAVPPSGFMFRPVETAVTWSAGIGSGMDLGIDVDDETPDDTEDSVDSTADGGQSSTENGRPPFVTDGRGRVIGASEEEQDNALSRSFFGRFFFSRSS